MAEFYNPYQFIEFTGKVNGENVSTKSFEEIKQGKTHIRHDYWQAQADIHHGRIVCEIELLSPTITGNIHVKQDNDKTTVEQYQFNKKYAIQANSLRGMIGSLVETLSQSSLRVLSNRHYSLAVGQDGERKEIDEPTFDFFSTSKSEPSNKNYSNALPWGSALLGRSVRKELTPAETLLGVVAVTEKDQENQSEGEIDSQNLASRIRFSDALGTQIQITKEPIPLKILSSPKPNGGKVNTSETDSKEVKATPSACMYFKPRNGSAYIASKDLYAGAHEANGRKFYLPHKTVNPGTWKENTTGHENQKTMCQPMIEKQKLYFHIDFNNLTSEELGLVQTAIQPTNNYQHTLGLGKSLGLGQVKVQILGTFFIDRQQRYQSLEEGNYHALNKGVDNLPYDSLLTQRYPEEIKAYTQALASKELTTKATLVDTTTHQLLSRFGDISQQRSLPISFPYTDSQKPYNEIEAFEWHVKNKQWQQFLPTLNEADKIPTLTTDGKKSVKKHNIQINLLSPTEQVAKDELINFIQQQLEVNNISYSKIASNKSKEVRLLVAENQIKQACQLFITLKIKDTYRLNCREL